MLISIWTLAIPGNVQGGMSGEAELEAEAEEGGKAEEEDDAILVILEEEI